MVWVIVLGVVVLAFVLLSRSDSVPGPTAVAAATNALLAEHTVRPLAPAAKNPLSTRLREHVVAVYRNAGFPNQTEASIAESFNGASRLEQLNILAMALDRLGISPKLPGEHWLSVKNPFAAFPPDATGAHPLISQTMDRLVAKHNIGLDISINQKFQMDEMGIWDGATPKANQRASHPDARLEWLTQRMTVAEAEAENQVQLDELGPRPIPFGSLNESWKNLLAQMRAEDELWEFMSPPSTWASLNGRAGMALVRNGVIVAVLTTRMN
jgi:hypothetical protein